MKNPFLDFKKVTISHKDLPLEQIVRKNRQVLDDLLAGYLSLSQDKVKELCRLLNHSLRFNVYKAWLLSMELPKFFTSTLAIASTVYESSIQAIRGIQYAPHDIEELCAFLGLSKETELEQCGHLGLYLSALINASDERSYTLDLQKYPGQHHFMGFRLEAGKHLSVKGNLGHFSGADLRGGYLNVTGSTGSWCGAGMTSGRIHIGGDALSKTGEQMTGGQIRVSGSIREIAKYRSGGEIKGRQGENRNPG